MKKHYAGLMIVVSVIALVLISFLLYNQWPLLTGQKVVLDTQPVDPFDPFRGQYMNINYQISSVTAEGFEQGDTIFVLLKEDDEGIWRFDGTSDSKPQRGDFIRGEVTGGSGSSVRVHYGIEQFFFERDADLPTRNITVEVAIASSGRPMLSQMLFNGEPLEIIYKEFDITS